MELYDNPFSPYAFKVRATLYEKNVPHEKREIRKRADHAKLLRVNPRAEVPAIVDGGTAISDSKVFMGYPPGEEYPALAAWLERGATRPSLQRAMRELAEGYAASQQPDSIFDPNRLHWRDARLEFALRVGLGPWLLSELAKDRAFLSPIS